MDSSAWPLRARRPQLRSRLFVLAWLRSSLSKNVRVLARGLARSRRVASLATRNEARGSDAQKATELPAAMPVSAALGFGGGSGSFTDFYFGQATVSRAFGIAEPYLAYRYQRFHLDLDPGEADDRMVNLVNENCTLRKPLSPSRQIRSLRGPHGDLGGSVIATRDFADRTSKQSNDQVKVYSLLVTHHDGFFEATFMRAVRIIAKMTPLRLLTARRAQ